MADIIIIGAGAAGMFCAAELHRRVPRLGITILEAGRKSLAKVAVTGGGRCNLTNSFEDIVNLVQAYPRGERIMKRALGQFSVKDTLEWFRSRGVALVLQDDHCWFPKSQDAMEIVRTLRNAASGAEILLGKKVTGITDNGDCFSVTCGEEEFCASHVVVTAGGLPAGTTMFDPLNLEMVPSVPSLFTFRIDDSVTQLMGLVVGKVTAAVPGTKFRADGPLLITDWGMSGPAILRLSSYAARYLKEKGYQAPLSVNWLNVNYEKAHEIIRGIASANPQKMVESVHPDAIPSRLWAYLAGKAGVGGRRWAEIGKTGMNRLCSCLTDDNYRICGRAKFKDEFVTCGGVGLGNIDPLTMEAKKHPGLYFAGEVLDIDAITGGFNLQAAWSTAYCAAKSIARKYGDTSH